MFHCILLTVYVYANTLCQFTDVHALHMYALLYINECIYILLLPTSNKIINYIVHSISVFVIHNVGCGCLYSSEEQEYVELVAMGDYTVILECMTTLGMYNHSLPIVQLCTFIYYVDSICLSVTHNVGCGCLYSSEEQEQPQRKGNAQVGRLEHEFPQPLRTLYQLLYINVCISYYYPLRIN